MEYKNIQNGKNNDDFKRFILKAIIWTVLLTVSGIFLFPFIGWIIGKCFPVYVMLIVFASIGALFLIVWLVHLVLGIINTHTSHFRFNLPIPKPSPRLLVLSFSVIIVCSANMLIDDSGKCIIGTFGYGERWGNSIVTERERVYNMFGVEKIRSERNDDILRMYSSENEKTILVLSMEEQKTDEWDGNESFKMICKSVEYRTDGTPIRVFEEKTACYYYYDYDYCIDHDYDEGCGYYFGGKRVNTLKTAIREWYFERIGLVCLSEYPIILKESLSDEKETFSNVNNSQQESHYESIYDDNSQQESHYESIYDAPAPQTQSWGGNMMPVQDFGGGDIYGGIESSSQQHGYITETYEDYCPVCYGSGKCQNCYGRGTYNDYTNTTRDCPSCINGNCSNCGGTGRVTKTRTVWK